MRVNYKTAETFVSRLDSIAIQTQNDIILLENQISELSVNSGVEEVAEELKKIKAELEAQLVVVKKMKISIGNILDVFRNGEQKLKNTIEGDKEIKKLEYVHLSLIGNSTSFDWKIR